MFEAKWMLVLCFPNLSISYCCSWIC